MSGRKTTEKKTYVRNGIGRLVAAGLAIIIQVVWLFVIYRWAGYYYGEISTIFRILGLLLVLYIYNSKVNSGMKMPWMILITVLPVLGVLLYVFVGLSGYIHLMRKKFDEIDAIMYSALSQDDTIMKEIGEKNKNILSQVRYLSDYTKFPVYRNQGLEYYDNAKDAFERQKEDLRHAKKFIFLEYHAVEDARAFHEMEEILIDRVEKGVEVRLIYDDVGSIGFITTDFIKRMENKGIICRCFNPVSPLFSFFFNNRDHRKITVIDGLVGYTGGYNLANEYFGYTHPYGEWKDTGVRLEGDAVRSLTLFFLEMWNGAKRKNYDTEDIDKYLKKDNENVVKTTKGYVQPYLDSPLDNEHVGENVYLNMINGANEYIYITTPYLIVTDEMQKCLRLAAKRGVDVRIITPGIPDKKSVYRLTKSYYSGLCSGGVRIFEYTPGFIHAKTWIADDHIATCGTINLDYRSLYHNFENGFLMYDCDAVMDVKKDFLKTFEKCREVTAEYAGKQKKRHVIADTVLRLLAPLL